MTRTVRMAGLVSGCLVLALAADALGAETGDKATALRRAQAARTAAATLQQLANQAAPKGLSALQQQGWKDQTATLNQAMGQALASATGFGEAAGLSGASMIEKMAAMNAVFLQLQAAVEAESQRFQKLSNASKERHDAAMNAIRNMR